MTFTTFQVVGDCGETVQTLTLYWNNTWDSGKLVREGWLSLLFTQVVREINIFYLYIEFTRSMFYKRQPIRDRSYD